MNENSVRELEWFDLETRLREIIYQQLEIFNKKAREDRESHSGLASNVEALEKRLTMVEGCMFGESSGNSILNELKKKISDVEGSRKRDMVRFDQEVVSFKEKLKTVNFQLTGNTDMIKRVEGLQDELTKDIQKVKDLVEDHQNLILKEIEQINTHFKEMNSNYLDKGLKLEEKMNSTLVKLEDINLAMLKYDRQFEALKKNLNDIYISINTIKTNKLEFETYDTDKTKYDTKLQELNELCQSFNSYFAMRDSYTDKFIPLQIATYVSDALHNCLDPFAKRRFAEYENVLLKQLHQAALEAGTSLNREDAIGKVLENVKHVEQRKTEILIEKVKEQIPVTVNRPNENKEKTPSKAVIPQEKYHENYTTKEDILQQFEKFVEIKLDPLLNKTKFEINEKFETLKKNITSSENVCMLYTQQVLREVEDLKSKEVKDIQNLELMFATLKEDDENFKSNFKEILNVIGSTSQMLVCLVENAQIDLALTAQEEEIRQDANESAILRPRPPENTQKKGGTSFNSGHVLMPIRPPVIKTPPLLYRSRKFQRSELVEMKGKMLKLCWESVSKNIPWRQEDFEYIISEAVKSLKVATSDDSQIEMTGQQSKDSLPYVVSPSLRTRTPHNKKYKFP
ncbi:hypothetical protein SteCoe_30799 [Stentor coeruleus]|uniref:Uncharacterized protein n=1 Tax=Stentor coeruleus TaxID=5963 RepID=A0A1R2B2S6_9CILI|nr:hypothetical protein SteCoe_30799 [Stentor coeruleus]